MRWVLWGGALLLAVLLAGCGGGADPIPHNLLTINYLDELTSIPQGPSQSATTTEEYFSLSSRLRIFDETPPMTHVKLMIPYFNTVLSMAGPYSVPPTDGTNTGSVPFKVYWGSSDTVPAGQPVVVTPGMVMPGYDKSAVPGGLYVTSANFTSAIPISGTYYLSADNGVLVNWESPATQHMMTPVQITEPSVIAVDGSKPIHVAWDSVPDAVGYLVIADSLHDTNNSSGEQAVWTSASKPIVFEAVDYHVPYLLPPSTHEVTIPAGIFHGCQTILVRVLAHGVPYYNTKTAPNLRLVCGALTDQIYVLVQSQ